MGILTQVAYERMLPGEKRRKQSKTGEQSKDVVSTGDELQYNSGLVPAGGKMEADDGTAGSHLLSGKFPLAERETGKVVNNHSSQQQMNIHQAGTNSIQHRSGTSREPGVPSIPRAIGRLGRKRRE